MQQAKDGLDAYWVKKSNVFCSIENSEPEETASFDRLHFLHGGLWGKHMLKDLKLILKALGHNFEVKLEENIAGFPQWRGLVHFDTVIHITYSDGNKMHDLSQVSNHARFITHLFACLEYLPPFTFHHPPVHLSRILPPFIGLSFQPSELCRSDWFSVQQALYACLDVLTHSGSPVGYQMLRMLRSYLQLDSLIGLDIHTDKMVAAIEAELLVFSDELKVCHSFYLTLDVTLWLMILFPGVY
ncbi:hypothetical protein BDN67DRAFT_1016452 [Paxillus ammoniavirescens]|nr:hypothetical protein BDN67DRAFT_1016452 [Paxillus ammoniavirescens]